MTIKQKILSWISTLPDNAEFTIYQTKRAVKAYTHHIESIMCELANEGIIDRVKWGTYKKGKIPLVSEE